MSNNVEPCKFCSKVPKPQWNDCEVPGAEDCGFAIVGCCHLSVHADTIDEVVSKWNKLNSHYWIDATKVLPNGEEGVSNRESRTVMVLGKSYISEAYHVKDHGWFSAATDNKLDGITHWHPKLKMPEAKPND